MYSILGISVEQIYHSGIHRRDVAYIFIVCGFGITSVLRPPASGISGGVPLRLHE